MSTPLRPKAITSKGVWSSPRWALLMTLLRCDEGPSAADPCRTLGAAAVSCQRMSRQRYRTSWRVVAVPASPHRGTYPALGMTERPQQNDPRRSTESGTPVKPVYGPEDLADFDPASALGEPGSFPYTRGVYPSMYTTRPWTMRQYAGFGTAAGSKDRKGGV